MVKIPVSDASSQTKGLYEFSYGISADEIRIINKSFGGSVELNGTTETILDSASRYEGFWNKVAAIIRSIIKNHTFDNGNKRTAQAVIEELIKRNQISTGVKPEVIKNIIYKVAIGELNTVEEISKMLRGF